MRLHEQGSIDITKTLGILEKLSEDGSLVCKTKAENGPSTNNFDETISYLRQIERQQIDSFGHYTRNGNSHNFNFALYPFTASLHRHAESLEIEVYKPNQYLQSLKELFFRQQRF